MPSVSKLKYSEWAFITGASSGIGAEFAYQIASQNINLVLVGVNQSRLTALSKYVSSRYGVKVRPLNLDLTRPDAMTIIAEATRDLQIELLINNAGTGLPGAFLEHDVNSEVNVAQLNAIIPMQLTHFFANKMVVNRRGGIIFVASTLGYMGTPYAANYSATKAYIITMGEALYYEMKKVGIDVLVVAPGPTKTPAVHLTNVDFSQIPVHWMEPQEVVCIALESLGKEAVVIPGNVNNLLNFISKRVLGRASTTSILGKIVERIIE